MNNTILLVIFSLLMGSNCYFQLTRFGSKPGCDTEVYHIALQNTFDCAVQECRQNRVDRNSPEYVTNTCGESERSFNEALHQYGSGRNFSLLWMYSSTDCTYPYAIEAVAVDSCEGAEHYECQKERSEKCLYIEPQKPDVPVSAAIPAAKSPKPQEVPTREVDQGGFFSRFERAVVGLGVTGWLLVLLLAVLVWKYRKDKLQALNGYAPLPKAGDNAFGIFFDLEQPKPVQMAQQVNVPPAPASPVPKPPLVQEEKPNMLRIPATELTINHKKKLGSGQASEVFECMWRQKKVAVKIPRDKDASTKVIKELAVLMELEPHPNIVEVFGYFELEQKICVVLELCNGSNLEKFVTNAKDLPSSDRLGIAMGIAAGMMHLHHAKRQVIHRDLKPSNILLTKIGSRRIPKIADFDYSRLLLSPSGMTYSTPDIAYAAPESLAATQDDKKEFSVKSDVWAYGATLFFLLTGQPPFGARSSSLKSHRLNKQVNVRFDLLEKLQQDPLTSLMVDITRQCLEDEPKKRPNFDQIDESFQAFFNNFPRANNNNL